MPELDENIIFLTKYPDINNNTLTFGTKSEHNVISDQ